MKGAVSLPLMGIVIIEFSTEDISGCFCVCVCVCARVRVRVRVHVCAINAL